MAIRNLSTTESLQISKQTVLELVQRHRRALADALLASSPLASSPLSANRRLRSWLDEHGQIHYPSHEASQLEDDVVAVAEAAKLSSTPTLLDAALVDHIALLPRSERLALLETLGIDTTPIREQAVERREVGPESLVASSSSSSSSSSSTTTSSPTSSVGLPPLYRVHILIKSFEPDLADAATHHLSLLAALADLPHPLVTSLPTERNMTSIHKSPFKYKKAQEQWWLTTHKRSVEYDMGTRRQLQFLLHCVRHSKLLGCQADVTIHHRTPLYPRGGKEEVAKREQEWKQGGGGVETSG